MTLFKSLQHTQWCSNEPLDPSGEMALYRFSSSQSDCKDSESNFTRSWLPDHCEYWLGIHCEQLNLIHSLSSSLSCLLGARKSLNVSHIRSVRTQIFSSPSLGTLQATMSIHTTSIVAVLTMLTKSDALDGTIFIRIQLSHSLIFLLSESDDI